MEYLVTGCVGFIGARVAEFLLREGHRVFGIDNINDAYDVRLKHWRLEQLRRYPDFRFQRLDIADRAAIRKWLDSAGEGTKAPSFDAVIHLAARAGVRQSIENPGVYFETNVIGTLNLLDLCRERGVQKFVLASSSSLYGISNPRPFREDANTDALISPYAASKKAAEVLTYTYHALHHIDVTALRYFTVYGPAGRPDMSPFRFVQWISEGRPVLVYGDGTQERDFTYIDEIAQATLLALKPMGYEIINVGSDRPIKMSSVIHTVENLVGQSARVEHKPPHPADLPATWADIGKAERLLGWRPRIQFDEGMARLVQWYQENRAWAKEIVTGQ